MCEGARDSAKKGAVWRVMRTRLARPLPRCIIRRPTRSNQIPSPNHQHEQYPIPTASMGEKLVPHYQEPVPAPAPVPVPVAKPKEKPKDTGPAAASQQGDPPLPGELCIISTTRERGCFRERGPSWERTWLYVSRMRECFVPLQSLSRLTHQPPPTPFGFRDHTCRHDAYVEGHVYFVELHGQSF